MLSASEYHPIHASNIGELGSLTPLLFQLLKIAFGGLLAGWRVEMDGGKGRPKNRVFEEVMMPLQGAETRVHFVRLKEEERIA